MSTDKGDKAAQSTQPECEELLERVSQLQVAVAQLLLENRVSHKDLLARLAELERRMGHDVRSMWEDMEVRIDGTREELHVARQELKLHINGVWQEVQSRLGGV